MKLILFACSAIAVCLARPSVGSEVGCFGSGATVGAAFNSSGAAILITVHVDDGVCHIEETSTGLISVTHPCVSQFVTGVTGITAPATLVLEYVYADGTVRPAAPLKTIPVPGALIYTDPGITMCGKDLRVRASVSGIGSASAAMRCSECIT